MSRTASRSYPASPLYSTRPDESGRRRPALAAASGYAIALAVGASVFLVALERGGYDELTRSSLAIAVWWGIALAVGLRLAPIERVPLAAIVTGAALAALAVWTLASMAWADDNERVFAEFDRVTLFLGLFTLVVLLSSRATGSRWADGLALGVAGIGVLALVSRLFPDLGLASDEIRTFLSFSFSRLHYPLGYWNGLAIFTAIAFPLLLRVALGGRHALVKGLALAPLPALAGTIYLTSSRGGFAAAAAGAITFLLLAARRWTAVAAAGLAGLGAVGVIAVLYDRQTLVNDPANVAVAEDQGRTAALLIAAICALVGLAWAAGCAVLERRLPESARLDRAAAALVLLAAVVGVVALDPIDRFNEFKALPAETAPTDSSDPVTSHLLSSSSTGRWQQWNVAIDEFEDHPLRGAGAGSYEAAWAQRAPVGGFVRDAHSLYLEVLGELGLVGLLLLCAAFLTAAGVGLRRVFAAEDERTRLTAAAVTAAFAAYAVGAGVDWLWELTAVSVVGITLLALATGPATAGPAPRRPAGPAAATRRGLRLALSAVVVVSALIVVGAQAIPLLSELKLRDSRAAVARGDAVDAIDDALTAKSVEPWAASPYLQVALVNEQVGRRRAAYAAILDAIERAPSDWRLWIVRSRVETKLGRVQDGLRSLARARELNPRSPLLAEPPPAP